MCAHDRRRTVSARGTIIAQRFAADLEDLRDHEKQHGDEVEAIVCSIVAHLRSWKPESVTSLGVLPEPEAPITDPRVGR